MKHFSMRPSRNTMRRTLMANTRGMDASRVTQYAVFRQTRKGTFMKSIKAVLTAGIAVALLAAGAVSLAGCGPSAEEVVRQGVSDELERLKTHDSDLLAELAADSGADQLAVYGIDAQEFVGAYLNGFDYRIDDVAVDGDTATATVVLTCKKFDEFTGALSEASMALAADEETAALSVDEVNQKIGQTVLEVLEAVEPSESAPIELTFTLKDKAWMPTSDTEKALSAALFGE